MRDFLKETIEILADYGKKISDIKFLQMEFIIFQQQTSLEKQKILNMMRGLEPTI